jgi:hypothetical protein
MRFSEYAEVVFSHTKGDKTIPGKPALRYPEIRKGLPGRAFMNATGWTHGKSILL